MDTIHLYGINKKMFDSRLFRKNVIPEDPDYWFKVLAETLYRIDYLKELYLSDLPKRIINPFRVSAQT